MPRAVVFTRMGPSDALEVVEVEPQHPGPGEVRVQVRTAGLNPVDWKIIAYPVVAERYGIGPLPSGNGNDFAGVIDEVGPDVEGWSAGDEVFGGYRFHAQADLVVVPASRLHRKPAGLDWDRAGSLDIVGRTAVASVRSLGLSGRDTVLVSAAAGGVGALAAQLAVREGARVIGTAGEANHAFLRSIGVVPIAYGDGLAERIRDVAPEGITAVLDNHGPETIEVAIELGVDPARINTIAASPRAAEVGAATVGGALAHAEDLDQIAGLIASGDVLFPIDSVYPVERVREAYTHLQAGHLQGKVVLAFE